MRPELCEDALRLGRILAGLVPREPEVHGLVALMELQASRAARRGAARRRAGAAARPGPLALGPAADRPRPEGAGPRRGARAGALGPYALQAAIAACHARARTPEQTDWERIVALYDGLAALTGSPVVELNRAVAVAMAFGPAAGLELVDALGGEPALAGYHLLPSVRGDLLARLGPPRGGVRRADARRRHDGNERERMLLLERAAGLARDPDGPPCGSGS